MRVIFVLFSIVDIIGALFILFPNKFFLGLNSGQIGIFLVGKGIWSILSSIAFHYFFDWMGWTDVVGGVALLLIHFKIPFKLSSFVGILLLLKGLYCLIRTLLRI